MNYCLLISTVSQLINLYETDTMADCYSDVQSVVAS